MTDTMVVRSGDFFVADHAATIRINGGSPPIYILDEELLSDLRSGSVSHTSDMDAAEGLIDLLEDDLLEFVSRGTPQLTDKEMTQVSRALAEVTERLGMPANLPFRNFTTFQTYLGKFPSSKIVQIQADRETVMQSFKPLRTELAERRRRADGLEIHEDLIAKLRDPAAILEHLRRLPQTADTDPPLTIGTAKELIESTAKTVLLERGLQVADNDDLPALVRKAQAALGLRPSRSGTGPDQTDALNRILGGLANIAGGLGELRNRGYGTGHGPSGERVGLRPRHARLAADAARTWCNLMLDTLTDPEAPWRKEDNEEGASPTSHSQPAT